LITNSFGGLFGTTSLGGSSNQGTVFVFYSNRTSFTTLHSFTTLQFVFDHCSECRKANGDGAYPRAAISMDNTLYGMAGRGGSEDAGTLFKVDGTSFTNLHSFSDRDGAGPNSLLLSGDTLYGTTIAGGSSFNGDIMGTPGFGTVFAVSTDGTGFRTLYDFGGGTDGRDPNDLVLSGGVLYGTAALGGTSGSGAIFKLSTNGRGFATLHNFSARSVSSSGNYTNLDGAIPIAASLLSGNTLYGATENGGSSGNGTLFKVNTDGTSFTTLHNFTGVVCPR